jgi:hypothetical protein
MSSESEQDPVGEPGWLPIVLACLAVLLTLAVVVGSDDDKDHLVVDRFLDWLAIGPLWGAVVYLNTRQKTEGQKRGRVVAIGTALLAWLLTSLALQWWTDKRAEDRLNPAHAIWRGWPSSSSDRG